MTYLTRFCLILTLAAGLAPAQIVPGRFILELDVEPIGAATKPGSARRMAAVHSAQTRLRNVLASQSILVLDSVENVANALIVETTDASVLSGIPGILRVHPVRKVHKLLDRAVPLQKINEAWAVTGGIENAGRGIRIGIIDTGIDSTAPGFQDPELVVPAGFPRVSATSELGNTNSKIIVARQYDRRANANSRDVDGHGTGVAMIAAGRTTSGPRGLITGVAPKAFLGIYKVFPDVGDASTDIILKAIDDAVSDGMNILNMSLGLNLPPQNPAEDIMVRAVERAYEAGVLVVVAAGNRGPDAGTIDSPGDASSAISVGNAASDRIFASFVRVESGPPHFAIPGDRDYRISTVSGPLHDVTDVDASSLACNELPVGSLNGQIALILRGSCLFETKIRHAQDAGAVGAVVYATPDSPAPLIMGVGTAELPAMMVGNSDGVKLRQSSATSSSVATLAITPQAISINPSQVANSSSRGPNVDFTIKPDLIAVGTAVYTASFSVQGQPAFQILDGTSFSSPAVAGVAALLKAARPGLTTAQYRSLLMNSAANISADPSTDFPVQHTGAGRLNALAAVRSTIVVAPQSLSFGSGSSAFNVGRRITLTNLGSDDDTFNVTVRKIGDGPAPDFSQPSVFVPAGGSREISFTFSGSEVPSGQYSGFFVIRGTASDSEARVPYWFGIPSQIVNSINVAALPEFSSPLATEQILVRPTDGSGFPIEIRPKVTVVEGDGQIGQIVFDRQSVGFYDVTLKMGALPGNNVFDIEAGGVTKRIVIPTIR
ncbi:MAG: S8 family serine peptidase [Bryobacteraceae bacterium]|nr:S8 family serine peptidase [Bryobacteraceae bacterium]